MKQFIQIVILTLAVSVSAFAHAKPVKEGPVSRSSYKRGSADSSAVNLNVNRKHSKAAVNVQTANWSTSAMAYTSHIGQRFTFYFAPGGMVSTQVWGTGIYTADGSIASAAVHAGLITPGHGGFVTIEMLPRQASYKGSAGNGINSHDWGSFSASFKFVKTEEGNNQ